MEKIESIKEFGGQLNRYKHHSEVCHSDMIFSVYLPPQAENGKVPALYWLSGLTCTDDNFRTKAGAQRYAAELGVAIVMPDTSPRGDDVIDYPDRYDLGKGAGFYVNATEKFWDKHYHMYDYVTKELPALIDANFPVSDIKFISGHSMGGHGALICALKNPGTYRSVSAFSPICHPSHCPWGQGCFTTYLGDDTQAWRAYDATCLIEDGAHVERILVDQGDADEFLEEQLFPKSLKKACKDKNIDLTLRLQNGYDHSYHFVGTFFGEHLRYHLDNA